MPARGCRPHATDAKRDPPISIVSPVRGTPSMQSAPSIFRARENPSHKTSGCPKESRGPGLFPGTDAGVGEARGLAGCGQSQTLDCRISIIYPNCRRVVNPHFRNARRGLPNLGKSKLFPALRSLAFAQDLPGSPPTAAHLESGRSPTFATE